MRNRIFGIIGALWGGAIVVSGLIHMSSGSTPDTSAGYSAGNMTGWVIGALMLGAGLYYAIKG